MDDKNDSFYDRFEVDHKTAFEGKIESFRMNLSVIKMTDDVIEVGLKEVFDEVTGILTKRLDNLTDHYRIMATIHLEGVINEYDYTVFAFDAPIKLKKVNNIKEHVKERVEKVQQKIKYEYEDYNKLNNGEKHLLYLYLRIYIFTSTQSNDKSFERSLLAALHPDDDKLEVLEKFSSDIDIKDIDYPIILDDIPRIEEKNNISINVYISKQKGEEEEGPVYHTKQKKEKHIDLLWSCENDNFSYIKVKKNKDRKDWRCESCLNWFDSDYDQTLHKGECLHVKTSIPQAKTIQYDKDRIKEVPFVVYADFETAVSKIKFRKLSQNMPNENWTKNLKRHVPYRYGYYIKCDDDNFSLVKTKVNRDLTHIVETFTDDLVKDLKTKIVNYKKQNPEAYIKIVPVFMHNFKSESSCFIVQGSNCESMHKSYTAIHKTVKTEIGDIQLRFLESRGFLDEALEDSVKGMKIDFNEICYNISIDEGNTKETLIKAGGFPFPKDYIESSENLSENHFPKSTTGNNSILICKNMSEEKYQVGNKLWEKFNCQDINDYLNFRIKVNILFLADIIQSLRRLCTHNYGLDPACYYSIAGFSWNAMLKSTNIILHLLPDVEMLLFIKKAIRGGYIQCSKRLAIANNKKLSYHDLNKEESNLMFYDANNLYGHIMCQNLPYGSFEWVDTNVDYKVGENSDVGYLLEVDIIYPDSLHNCHSDFPFFPVKKNVDGNDFKLLVSDLKKRDRYVVHYLYLEEFEAQGGKVEKIYRILKFNQKPWLREYIKDNIEKRNKAKTESEKKFFKLLNNSIYGKTMQNVENQGDILLINHWEDLDNQNGAAHYIQRPDFQSLSICSKNTVAIKLRQTNLTFKYPIYIGCCILDIAKAVIYNFHYKVMKSTFGNNISLLYTDTDSLVYEFKGDSYEKLMGKADIKELLDVDKYATDNNNYDKLYSCDFKDEVKGAVIKEFVGLKSKMYAVSAERKSENGRIVNFTIKKSAHLPSYVKETLSTEDYKSCLQSNKPLYKEFIRVRALDHDLYTQSVRKIVISPNDKKRKILTNNIDTLPWGHFSLNEDN